jgi:hypothetical protein
MGIKSLIHSYHSLKYVSKDTVVLGSKKAKRLSCEICMGLCNGKTDLDQNMTERKQIPDPYCTLHVLYQSRSILMRISLECHL